MTRLQGKFLRVPGALPHNHREFTVGCGYVEEGHKGRRHGPVAERDLHLIKETELSCGSILPI